MSPPPAGRRKCTAPGLGHLAAATDLTNADRLTAWDDSAEDCTVTRPLVVRFGSLGDMVIALTVIRALHQRFGGAGLPARGPVRCGGSRPVRASQPEGLRDLLARTRSGQGI